MKVVFVLGTRPEITKTVGIISNLSSRAEIPVSIVLTGQQTDLVRETIKSFNEFESIEYCWFGDKTAPRFDPRWKPTFRESFANEMFYQGVGMVVATGDTDSVLAAAEMSSNLEIPFLHLEAGVRHNREMDLEPEEKNRRAITPLATYHFCPSASQRSVLLKEGVPDRNIFVFGDLSKVSIATTWKKLTRNGKFGGQSVISEYFNYRKQLCVCTFHRSTSLANLDALTTSFADLVGFHPGVNFLVCARPDTRWQGFNHTIGRAENVSLIPAPPPFEFQQLLAISDMVVTDSAGVQQEAALLSKPCVALRANFELGGDDPLLYKVSPPFRDLERKFLSASRTARVNLAINLSLVRMQGEAMIDRTSRMIEHLVNSRGLLRK